MSTHQTNAANESLARFEDVDSWTERLEEAFAEGSRDAGFLTLAEQAERACPGDPAILFYATLAALLDAKPDRAQVYLKRFARRYDTGGTHQLLSALTLGGQGKLILAKAQLERNGFTDWRSAIEFFPGGFEQRSWLADQIDTIMGRPRPGQLRGRPAKKLAPKTVVAKPGPKTPTQARSHARGPAASTEAKSLATPSVTSLEPLPVSIPLMVECDLSKLLEAAVGPPEVDGGWFGLRERLARLGLAQDFDELLCVAQLTGIETFWHQTETVRKVLKQFRGRVLLADEVGLGKTVEAGMVLKEYLLRGMAERVLVLVPASLVGQWREELETKFDIPCATTHDAMVREDPERFWASPRIIASLALARRSEHAQRLLAQSFDIVIVDEAHHLRDRASQSYKLVDGLNKRFLLLLSATPVQNNLIELYNLLTLLKPGIFKTQKEFRAAYMTPGKPRQPANPDRLRDLMRDAMIRNTRAVVALKLPRRHASTRWVDSPPVEDAVYQDTAAQVRTLSADQTQGARRLMLHHLLGAAGSSPAAAAAAISRFAERQGGEKSWATLAARWAGLKAGGKEMALLELLNRNPSEKKLVFIHHKETMASVAALLGRSGIGFARFEGSMSGPDKDAAISDFRERVPVLLCTESGGEGRNIQFCNTLINFDLPWNPMAIEQRIGRIDRIGQTREVFIFNLVARGTIEEQVLRLLDEKINMFELVVGEAGAILGDLEEERAFSELVLDAWLEATPTGRTDAFDALGRRLDEARTRYGEAQLLDEALFGEEFETA